MSDHFGVRINDQFGNTIGHIRRHTNTTQRSNNQIGQVFHNVAVYHILNHCYNYRIPHSAADDLPTPQMGEIFLMPLPEHIYFENCIALEPSSKEFLNSKFGFKARFSFSCITTQDIKLITDFLDALNIMYDCE